MDFLPQNLPQMKSFFILISSFLACLIQAQVSMQNPFEAQSSAVEWREIGPPRGGRSCAVTGVIGNDQLYYMGSTGGGVWKTKDAGRSWKNISDGYFGGSIGSVAVSTSDPNIVFVGTGEETWRGNVSSGHGVWKSEDAGTSWSFVGLKNTRHISRIRIHPKDPNIVLLAAMGDVFSSNSERGIFKTTDGGKTWRKTLFVSDSAGAVELVQHPTQTKIWFATTWNARRSPYSFSSGGSGCSLWKSTDHGESWKEIKSNKGLPGGLWGISMITICESNPDRMYAMIENEKGGVYRTDDGGINWELVNDSRDLRQRAWYFSRIYADPNDANTVYALNVYLHQSKDGGKTFKTINVGHGDCHDLWINPNNPKNLILADDGGAEITMNEGASWSSLHNQPTAQFYRISTDNAKPYHILVAQQDNSALRILHRTDEGSINSSAWEYTAGGESGHIVADPLNPDIVYGGSYGGLFDRRDHKNKINRSINIWPDNPLGHGAENQKYRFQWNFPIFFSPHNPKKLYAASNHLHASTDEGDSWTTLSPDLTRDDKTKQQASGGPITKDNTSVEYYCTLFAAAESPVQKDLLWVGSDDGLVHVSQDGGMHWTKCNISGLPEWTMINCIEPDPMDAKTCYIAATSYKSGDRKPYLFMTTDYGVSWKSINQGISNEHFTRAIRADKKIKGLLYAGTEQGMYISYNMGAQWYSFQKNLPITPVTDICLKEDAILISTQGRGVWMIDNLDPIRKSQAKISFALFTPIPALRSFGSQSNQYPNGKNLPEEFVLYSYIDSLYKDDTIHLCLLNELRDTVSHYSTIEKDKSKKLELKSGSNMSLLSYTYPAAKSVSGMILWWSSLQGPVAYPGNYKIIMQGKRFADSVDCKLEKDPRYPVTDDEVKEKYFFIKNCRDKLDEAHRCVIGMRDVRSQLSDFVSRMDASKENELIFKKQKMIDSILLHIENELYQTKNQSVQDPINYPIKLTNKLAHLSALNGYNSYPPTKQAEQFRVEVSKAIDEQIGRFDALKQNELKEFNQLIRDKEIPIINPKKIE